MEETKKDQKKDQKKTSTKEPVAKIVEKPMNIDEIFANDPNGYAAKFSPNGRKLIVSYLNSRPMVEVETFFANMFDIEDQDPFFTIPWVKKLFDYLKHVCPRGEVKDVVIGLANNTMIFKKTAKEEEKPAGEGHLRKVDKEEEKEEEKK